MIIDRAEEDEEDHYCVMLMLIMMRLRISMIIK